MKIITANFDGACEPKNPGGHMGIGAVIFIDGVKTFEHSQYVPSSDSNSNNVAEYMGCDWILSKLIAEGLENENITIKGDSQLVIKQLNNEWGINGGLYAQLARLTAAKAKNFKHVNFQWVPRIENQLADELSMRELKANGIKRRY